MPGDQFAASRILRILVQLLSLFSPRKNIVALRDCASFLWSNRQLTYEMAKKDLLERSHGQAFGYLWIFFQPLLLITVYSVIFVVIVRMRHPEAVSGPDYGLYVLSGLLVWLSSAEALSRSSTVLRSNASLIKQVIFPIEVLPVSNVLVTFFTQLIFLVGFGIIAVSMKANVGWAILLLPVAIIIQMAGLIGLSLIISAISIYFKDVKDILQAYLTIAVYTLPLFFAADQTPPAVRWIFEWNPFTSMIHVYRDILYTGKIEHPLAWGAFIGLSVLSLAIGYRFFRRVKVYFGSIL
jgi:lipopolysaccharide transport system permease protein